MTITTAGLTAAAKQLVGVVATPFKYMALGSGSTAADPAQTALVTEIVANGGERAEATASYVSGAIVQLTKTYTASGAFTVREFGIFNDASAGDMLNRYVWAGDAVMASGDTIQVTVRFTQA